LYKLVQDARRIIVMDNDLTDLNIEWIKALYKDKLFSIIHNTFQSQKGKIFRLAPNKETVLAELWDWAKQMSLLPFESWKSVSLICHFRKNVQGIVRALKTDFPELRIKEYHGKSDPVEKAHDFSNVEESWNNVDLVAYTSTLKIGISCTNPKFEQAFCLFNSYIKTNAGTNQMLFRMRYIKELQNRGIFPDIDSIIRNKDVPTVRLWVGMIISTIKYISKPGENNTSLSQVVKVNSATIKAEEISEITNAIILDHETAKLLENKPRKTLEEMRSLDRHHIVECYQIPPELLTEDFISEYENYNHMKWFRAYRQVRDAG
ncbi:2912_t:CDS:2, partial [Funneliformis geosporum]